MLKAIIGAAALLQIAACGTTAEIVIGAPVADGGFRGTGPTATLRIRKSLDDHAFCEYEHVSFVVVDRPEEDRLDQVGCGVRFGGN
jgi:hypothetical protein